MPAAVPYSLPEAEVNGPLEQLRKDAGDTGSSRIPYGMAAPCSISPDEVRRPLSSARDSKLHHA